MSLENAIENLADALNKHADAIIASCDRKVEAEPAPEEKPKPTKKKRAKPKAEPKPEPQVEDEDEFEDEAPASGPTIEDVRKKFLAAGRAVAVPVLKKFGCKRISDLDPNVYVEALDTLAAALDG